MLLRRGLHGEAPCGSFMVLGKSAEMLVFTSMTALCGTAGCMERDVELLRALEDRPEALVVEEEERAVHRGEAPRTMPLLFFELRHCAELVGGGLGLAAGRGTANLSYSFQRLDGRRWAARAGTAVSVDALRGGAVRQDL